MPTQATRPGEGGAAAPFQTAGAAVDLLDKHEGIARVGPSRCQRWPAHLRLASSRGKLVYGRCRATNLCDYCARLYVVETVEALTLDAMGGSAPTLWVVLTAREHLSRAELNRHLMRIRESLRTRRDGWPSCEWFVQVEFQRRGALHANLLVKGVAAGGQQAFLEQLVARWCARVDAEPWGQWGEAMGDAVAVSKYVSKMLAHGLKAEQRPPLGWKGHRTSHTRGYFGRPMWQVRRDAQASLRSKRSLYRALDAGYAGAEAEAISDLETLRLESEEWTLAGVSADAETGELGRVRAVLGGQEAGRRERRGRNFAADAHVAAAGRAMDEDAAQQGEDDGASGWMDGLVPSLDLRLSV